ncbi:MAG: threonylcarbamoyl-AMP synthase [Chitinophagaceae bacterium]|nr:MAG: threonylcarbamoyl-AMP synthase [Chitinophagaceae bacterium]
MDLLHYSVEQALHVLRAGGIILYPTDTVWGIGCDATDAKAVSRVFQLKQRDDAKSMIILAADERDILKYTANPDPAVFDYLRNSATPTTVIYENALGLPDNLVNQDGSIAIRITKEVFCKTLIKRLGKPIVSTSANISGQPSPKSFREVSKEIIRGVDYVVDYREHDETEAKPSRIIKLKANGEILVIRE